MKCPRCGADSSGAFCSKCGAPLKGAKCRECGSALTPGAHYCTNCGARTIEGSSGRSMTPWFVAGGALLVFVAVLLWPRISGQTTENERKVPISQVQNANAGAADQTGAAPEGPLTGSPREQADRLFNRIMSERENGDTARAKFFLPMGIQAYEVAGDLDADGLYHLSLLQSFSGDYAAARATAERVLKTQPDHLLALSAAGNAARAQGDKAAARKYYQRFLASYDTELKTSKEEYQDHSRILPELKKEAEQFK